jgi:hypothetical protein
MGMAVGLGAGRSAYGGGGLGVSGAVNSTRSSAHSQDLSPYGGSSYSYKNSSPSPPKRRAPNGQLRGSLQQRNLAGASKRMYEDDEALMNLILPK